MPYGAEGVYRQTEAVPRTPVEALDEAQRLLDEGMPFHAHEVLEDSWKAAPPAERELWRGLAQLAVGLTHRARGNPIGAAALLRRGALAIQPFAQDPPYGLGVARLYTWATSAADRLADDPTGAPSEAMPDLRGG